MIRVGIINFSHIVMFVQGTIFTQWSHQAAV